MIPHGGNADGNIKTLQRMGPSDPTNCASKVQIDNLLYTLIPGTPKLQKVADSAPSANRAKGFNPGTASGSAVYAYDQNGNLITDPYKDITIQYNFLNLPRLVTKGGANIVIRYDALGRKWSQTGTEGIKEYVGGIEYVDQKIQSVQHGEGRLVATYNGSAIESIRAEYWRQDHLGNTRVAFSDFNLDGVIATKDDPNTPGNDIEITQENHFYPFGLNHEGPWYATVQPKNKYQYNGKEYVEDLGLNWNDYGARWYDASTGRWVQVDPMADGYHSISPYSYVANNPVILVDPDGMRINVSHILKENPDEWTKVLNDLTEFTGLTITVDKEGFLNYEKPAENIGGSETARIMLMNAIEHKETVTVLGCEDCASAVTTMDEDAPIEKQNEFTLSRDQINRFIEGTSEDLSPRTFGFGANFLHELGHTRVGGRMFDTADNDAFTLGENVKNMNKIRKELGENFGQRVEYNPRNADPKSIYVYYAFSNSALRRLKQNKEPQTGFIKVLRYPKKN